MAQAAVVSPFVMALDVFRDFIAPYLTYEDLCQLASVDRVCWTLVAKLYPWREVWRPPHVRNDDHTLYRACNYPESVYNSKTGCPEKLPWAHLQGGFYSRDECALTWLLRWLHEQLTQSERAAINYGFMAIYMPTAWVFDNHAAAIVQDRSHTIVPCFTFSKLVDTDYWLGKFMFPILKQQQVSANTVQAMFRFVHKYERNTKSSTIFYSPHVLLGVALQQPDRDVLDVVVCNLEHWFSRKRLQLRCFLGRHGKHLPFLAKECYNEDMADAATWCRRVRENYLNYEGGTPFLVMLLPSKPPPSLVDEVIHVLHSHKYEHGHDADEKSHYKAWCSMKAWSDWSVSLFRRVYAALQPLLHRVDQIDIFVSLLELDCYANAVIVYQQWMPSLIRNKDLPQHNAWYHQLETVFFKASEIGDHIRACMIITAVGLTEQDYIRILLSGRGQCKYHTKRAAFTDAIVQHLAQERNQQLTQTLD
jgi:hypothetical protein